jgi:hypothetical protein
MAKPRELYSGPAPERVFAQMGAGIADAYANVGRIEGQGYAALGQGIGQGLQAVGSYVKQIKDRENENRSYENLLKNKIGQKFLNISADDANNYLAMLKDEKPSVKNKLLSQFFDQSVKAKMFGMEQGGKEKLQGMSDIAAMDRTKTSVLGGIAQAGMTAEARRKSPLPAITLDEPYDLSPAPSPTQGRQPPRVVEFDPQAILPQPQDGVGVSPSDAFYQFLQEKNIAPSEFDKWLNSLIPSRRVK